MRRGGGVLVFLSGGHAAAEANACSVVLSLFRHAGPHRQHSC